VLSRRGACRAGPRRPDNERRGPFSSLFLLDDVMRYSIYFCKCADNSLCASAEAQAGWFAEIISVGMDGLEIETVHSTCYCLTEVAAMSLAKKWLQETQKHYELVET
jgi:hypothetical protein